jgi:hypothetical protein
MISLRSLMSAVLAAALLALAGCGGGDEKKPPAPVQVDSASTARATLGPAGGTVVATAADGRRYTLTVEPGALATATEITATPVVSMGSAPLAAGLKGAVRFGPAGLRFALPATLRIEGVNPAASAGSNLIGFLRSADGTSMQLVPTTVAAAGTIAMKVRHFTDVGVSQATAQEVAQVPVDRSADPVEALLLEYIGGLSANSNTADTAALLVRLHDTRVAPRLTVAELRTVATDTEREVAIEVASEWISLVNDEFEVLPDSLAPLLTAMRQRVAAVISQDFDIGLAACMGPAPIGTAQLVGLQNALRTREQLRLFRDNGGLPGLDRETAKRRLNDCVRIVFEPRPLPTFEIGRPVSLDLRARLVFAADANATIEVPFEFDVLAPGSSGPVFGTEFISFGFSDARGNYTAVVTPRDADTEFFVEACMVVSPRNGGPVGSLLCGQQTLQSREPTPSLSQIGDYTGTVQDVQRGSPPRDPFNAEMTVTGRGGREVTVTVFRRVFDFFGVEKPPQVLYTGSGTIADDGSLQIGSPQDPEFYGTFSDTGFSGFIDVDGAAEVDLERVEMRRK